MARSAACGRFAGPWLLILASLADGPKHGYVIMIDVACFSGVSIAQIVRVTASWPRPADGVDRSSPYSLQLSKRYWRARDVNAREVRRPGPVR